ncbi:MAG: multicopper oxidase family protein [Gemmatimonadota bacterium]
MPRPPQLTRREFVRTATAIAAGAALDGPGIRAARSPANARPRFQRPLPIPPVLAPVRRDATTDYYDVVQRAGRGMVLPGVPTPVWGYDGLWPGPTIRARRGRTVVVRHTNALPVPTVVHLHGGETPPDSDGFPTDEVMPRASRSYTYPNTQSAATLWYHDHAMDHTGRNIYMGLAGFYLLEDAAEEGLGLPRGACDVPLLIQRRSCDRGGELHYNPLRQLGASGPIVTVNGAPTPHLEVAARKYRFRLLNGSNATPLRLALSSGDPLVVIATDTGLLPAPVPCSSIRLGMAERVEVVVDFSRLPLGSQLFLVDEAAGGDQRWVMRFDVARAEPDDSRVPERLGEPPELRSQDASQTRDFVFTGAPRGFPPRAHWTIDGRDFDGDRPIATPRYGDVEIWRLVNHRRFGLLGMLHTVHIHLVRFLILDRNGRAPEPYEQGWKDTVTLDKGDVVRVVMRFSGHRGRYLVHCHNLEHEDASMMARYDVV